MLSRRSAGRKGRAPLPQTWSASALAAGAVLAVAGMAWADDAQSGRSTVPPVTVGPVVQISGPSPFGDCTADDAETQQA